MSADEPKNHDFDVIREEAMVPTYHLPPILVSAEGQPITTPEGWFHVRRPQIMALFGNWTYGVVPAPESRIRTAFEVVRTNREFMGGPASSATALPLGNSSNGALDSWWCRRATSFGTTRWSF